MSKPFNPFQSPRLLYRAVEDTEEDATFIHAVQSDAEAQSGSMFGLLRPESMKNSKKWRDALMDRESVLLGAVVCLRPEETTGVAEASSKGKKSIPVPVGVVCLTALRPHHMHHRHSYISIDVLKSFQGKGYGSEAIEWVLGYGFQMAGLHRIGIEAFGYNEGAVRLYEKLGFTLEGRKREEIWFSGAWYDNVTFGMLKREWQAVQERKGRSWHSDCVQAVDSA